MYIPTPREIPKHQARMYRRGDIWFISANENAMTIGSEIWPNRPAVILSNNVSSNRSGVVSVVYLTGAKKKPSPTHVEIDTNSIALCEQIHTVSVTRLDRYIGTVNDENMKQVSDAVRFTLNLDVQHTGQVSTLLHKWENHLDNLGIESFDNPVADEDLKREIATLRNDNTRMQRQNEAMRLLLADQLADDTRA